MTKDLRLHILVTRLIDEAGLADCRVLKGRDCGGDRTLWIRQDRVRHGDADWAFDILVLKSGEVRVVADIEEGPSDPAYLYRKYSAVASAWGYVHRGWTSGESAPLAGHVTYLHVEGATAARATAEPSDLNRVVELIHEEMRGMPTNVIGARLKVFQVLRGTVDEFDGPLGQELLSWLRRALVD